MVSPPIRGIIDFTKNYPGSESKTAELARQFCADKGIEPTNLTVITRPDQAEQLSAAFPGARCVTAMAPSQAIATAEQLIRACEPAQRVHLVSYNGRMLSLESLNPLVEALSFSKVRRVGQFNGFPKTYGPRGLALVEPIVSETSPSAQVVVSADTVSSGESPATAAVEAAPSVAEEPRSRRMVRLLRERKMGPFAIERPLAYEALDEVIREGNHRNLAETLDRAIDRLRQTDKVQVKESPDSEDRDRSKLLFGIRQFLHHVLTQAKVVKDAEGSPIGSDWRGSSRQVAGLEENWRVKADAQVVLAIVREMKDITPRDLKNLARALFYSPDEQYQAHVSACVEYLLDSGKVKQAFEAGECYLRVGDETPPPTERLRAVVS
jgi:hypothetical protein